MEPPGVITGITRYTFGLTEAILRRADIRIVFVTAWDGNDLPPIISTGVESVVTLPHISSTPLNNLRQRRSIGHIARERDVDVVYAMNPTCPPVRGIPSIITVHDLYFEVLPQLYKRRHRLWWKLFFGDAARRSTRVAFASANSARDATSIYPWLAEKARVVAGAGVLPHGNSDLPPEIGDSPYVLLLGNVTPNKNITFAIEAFRLLSSIGEPVRALHVGRDANGDLANALNRGGTPEFFRSLGDVDDATLDALLRNAAALVQPSHYEGFGLPIIEAQERGVPVIASDIGVFREVAGDGCIFVPLGDVRRLAEALQAITGDSTMRARLSAAALLNSRRFTWDRSGDAAVSMINEITLPRVKDPG
ncbi:glycosyltransferase family 4 protein [Mycobacterium sp. TJFP1]